MIRERDQTSMQSNGRSHGECRLEFTMAVIERTRRKIRQPEHVIQLAHYQQTAVGTELRATKFQTHPAVKTKPPIARFACTLWVIHRTRP